MLFLHFGAQIKHNTMWWQKLVVSPARRGFNIWSNPEQESQLMSSKTCLPICVRNYNWLHYPPSSLIRHKKDSRKFMKLKKKKKEKKKLISSAKNILKLPTSSSWPLVPANAGNRADYSSIPGRPKHGGMWTQVSPKMSAKSLNLHLFYGVGSRLLNHMCPALDGCKLTVLLEGVSSGPESCAAFFCKRKNTH